MQKHTYLFNAIFIFLLIHACAPKGEIDREAVADAMKSREIKRVSTADILSQGMTLGLDYLDKINSDFLEGVKNGNMYLEVCDLSKLASFREMAEGSSVYRVRRNARNQQNVTDSLEQLIFEAYEYAAEEGFKLEPTIQEENEHVVLLTKPIFMEQSCLPCHGESTEPSEQWNEIFAMYPEDQSSASAIGDFMAMWSLRIPKSEIVNSLN